MAVKHHDPVGRYVTIEVDGQQYKVFYLQMERALRLFANIRLDVIIINGEGY